MNVEQTAWNATKGWEPAPPGTLGDAQLILLFGSRSVLEEQIYLPSIKTAYPKARLLGCSTSGEICGTHVLDDSLVATAIHFEHTPFQITHVEICDGESSFSAGERLAKSLIQKDLVHVFVLSDG